MLNRDLYQKNPHERKLVNEGVATVNDEKTDLALEVLRYELETFVCDGQYEAGLRHILETYLGNIERAQQPAVWVSGFYGSGKSHLVKMLRALWVDTPFKDKATARGIAVLPDSTSDTLRELTVQGNRHGGLHAASGTLGSGASGSVRLALMSIIFKSAGLPEKYGIARFVMWLKQEGILEAVRNHVESNGHDWAEELDNLYVAEGLHAALVAVKPQLFSSPAACAISLNNLYGNVNDISSDDMLKAIRLALTKAGKFPLTLIILDEVQQFIGESSDRSIEVQEMVEAITKSIGGKLMFIGTGQTAVTGTPNLARLQGRFTVRVELSDTDVDAVIRKVILAKKPEAGTIISELMTRNLGEISRQLQGSTIGHNQSDVQFFVSDYPILPVRRRFWERALRVLDQTGTDSQLRNQLSMIHKVVQTNADKPLGQVVGADYLYLDAADKLLQSRMLPRKVHEQTMTLARGDKTAQLTARALGLIFLISRVSDANTESGIRATVDTLADLLVEDLSAGSAAIRSALPGILDACDLVMKIGDEYRIQTEESSAWNDEFRSQQSILANESHRIDAERDDRIRRRAGELTRRLSISQGRSLVVREIGTVFDSRLPDDRDRRIYVWVRDGWSTDENSVRAEARQAGNSSPVIFVFLPRRNADDLRHQLIDFKAATATLERRGTPNTAEGKDASAAMDTVKRNADARIAELLGDILSGARVFQGGGTELTGQDLVESIKEAAEKSLTRLYPQFQIADSIGWDKVYAMAAKGAPDALKAVGDDGEAARNPVCKAILSFIAGGKPGADIRNCFESAPYGWSRDAVDGALMVLLMTGLVRAEGERKETLDFKTLSRSAMGKTSFRVESATVSAPQRVKIRKLFQKVLPAVQPGQEHTVARDFIDAMITLAHSAGGDEPRPQCPDTSLLESFLSVNGNEQLLAIYNSADILSDWFDAWTLAAERIVKRMESWHTLTMLLAQAEGVEDVDVLRTQVENIATGRLLLEEPDPMQAIIANLSQILRNELNDLMNRWTTAWNEGEGILEANANWNGLEVEQRHELRRPHGLVEAALPKVEVQSTPDIIDTIKRLPLTQFRDRIAALPGRYSTILLETARLSEPKAQEVQLPRRTLKTADEIETWLDETRKLLLEKIQNGPIVL